MGQIDIPLNQEGVRQAYAAIDILKKVPFTSIISSPLGRAVRTAEIIAEGVGKPLYIIDELKECDWGEGYTKADIENEESVWFQGWLHGTLQGAECYPQLECRLKIGLEKTFKFSEPALLISHGGVYWALSKMLGFAYQRLPHCYPFYISAPISTGDRWQVLPIADDDNW